MNVIATSVRAALRELRSNGIDPEALEESCLPSYAHPNPLAAYAAWWRLFTAVEILALHGRGDAADPVLDFGSSAGELRHLLDKGADYEFVEIHESLVDCLMREFPDARRRTIDSLNRQRYAAVFALDSLEHIDHPEHTLDRLAEALGPDGVLVLAGPTENSTYRWGRRVAGFSGHYHKRSIYDVEALVAARLQLLDRRLGPHSLPLFAVSAWSVQ